MSRGGKKYQEREAGGQLGLFSTVVAAATKPKPKPAANKPPKGYHPAPKSRKGGWTDGHGNYWYPQHHGGSAHHEAHEIENDRAIDLSGEELAADLAHPSTADLRRTALLREKGHRERHQQEKEAREARPRIELVELAEPEPEPPAVEPEPDAPPAAAPDIRAALDAVVSHGQWASEAHSDHSGPDVWMGRLKRGGDLIRIREEEDGRWSVQWKDQLKPSWKAGDLFEPWQKPQSAEDFSTVLGIWMGEDAPEPPAAAPRELSDAELRQRSEAGKAGGGPRYQVVESPGYGVGNAFHVVDTQTGEVVDKPPSSPMLDTPSRAAEAARVWNDAHGRGTDPLIEDAAQHADRWKLRFGNLSDGDLTQLARDARGNLKAWEYSPNDFRAQRSRALLAAVVEERAQRRDRRRGRELRRRFKAAGLTEVVEREEAVQATEAAATKERFAGFTAPISRRDMTKRVKAALRALYPGHKFSVRGGTGTGYNWIKVHGTTPEAEKVLDEHREKHNWRLGSISPDSWHEALNHLEKLAVAEYHEELAADAHHEAATDEPPAASPEWAPGASHARFSDLKHAVKTARAELKRSAEYKALKRKARGRSEFLHPVTEVTIKGADGEVDHIPWGDFRLKDAKEAIKAGAVSIDVDGGFSFASLEEGGFDALTPEIDFSVAVWEKPEPPAAAEPKHAFKAGDRVLVDGELREVWSVGQDASAGQLHIMDPVTRHKLWVNYPGPADIKPAPDEAATDEPPAATEPEPPAAEPRPSDEGREQITLTQVAVPGVQRIRETAGEHHEVGEHTPLSRKDTAVSTGPRPSIEERVAEGKVTRDDVLEKPTVEKAQARGDTPGAHHAKALLYKLVSPQPLGGRSDRWRRGRHALGGHAVTPAVVASNYHRGARLLTRTLDNCKTAKDVMQAISELQGLRSAEFLSREFPDPQVSNLGRFLRPSPSTPEHLRPGARASSGSKVEEQKAQAMAEWRAANPDHDDSHVGVVAVRWSYKQETEEERAARRERGEVGTPKTGVQYTIRDGFQRQIHERNFDALGEGFSKLTKGSLTPALRKALHAALKLDETTWEDADAQTKAKREGARAGLAWSDIRGESFDRVGGKEVPRADASAMLSTFGLRNVQPGANMSHEDRGFHIKAGHEALHDLADMLGVAPEVIGRGGNLAIAFGARGRGGKGAASAHYEPSLQVINITARAGAGSLAHEWGHFMDHMMGDGGELWLTRDGHHDPQVQAAMDRAGAAMFGQLAWERRKGLEKSNQAMNLALAQWRSADEERGPGSIEARRAKGALNSARRSHNQERRRYEAAARRGTQFARDAVALDGGRKASYWSRTDEMFARAFEGWVESSMVSQGRQNAYLVRGTREKAITFVSSPRNPDHVMEESQAAFAKGKEHPEAKEAEAKATAAREHHDKVEAAQITAQSKGRAKRNKWGQWSDAQRSRARSAPGVAEAHRAMNAAQAERSKTLAKHRPEVSKMHDGTEHPSQAQPYPQGAEREAINVAMRDLLGVLVSTGALRKALTKGERGSIFGTLLIDRLGG